MELHSKDDQFDTKVTKTLNSYQYANGDPVNNVDEDGHSIFSSSVAFLRSIQIAAFAVTATIALHVYQRSVISDSISKVSSSAASLIKAAAKKVTDKGKAKGETSKVTDRGSTKARDIITKEKKGAINQEFPKEWQDSTLNEIEKAAKQGNKSAQKAKKLLNDKRFDKGDNRK